MVSFPRIIVGTHAPLCQGRVQHLFLLFGTPTKVLKSLNELGCSVELASGCTEQRWLKFHAQNILPNRKHTFLSNVLNGE